MAITIPVRREERVLYGQVHGQTSLCFTTSFIALTGHRLPRAPHNTPSSLPFDPRFRTPGPSLNLHFDRGLRIGGVLAAERGAIHHGRRGHVTRDLGPRDA